jgi:hypothetical protein
MSAQPQPIEGLHLRAIEQRNQLHQTTAELKAKITETRERFDIERNLRRHLPKAAFSAAAVGLIFGYSLGRVLTRR